MVGGHAFGHGSRSPCVTDNWQLREHRQLRERWTARGAASCLERVFDERDASVTDGSGVSLPSTGSLTYVVVKDQDAWQIAAAQTTPIKT